MPMDISEINAINRQCDLEKTLKAKAPENPKYEPMPGETALLIIDVQFAVCDPSRFGSEDTKAIAERIEKAIPGFREAGIPIYFVRTKSYEKSPVRQMMEDPKDLELYKITPNGDEITIVKTSNSAFKNTDFASVLKGAGIKSVLACGFNFNACVRDTVLDALSHGFRVCVLKNLSGNDRLITEKNKKNGPYGDYMEKDEYAERVMNFRGATITDAEKVLKKYKKAAKPA